MIAQVCEKLQIVSTLEKAKELLGDMLEEGDAVLFLNDLPDAYWYGTL